MSLVKVLCVSALGGCILAAIVLFLLFRDDERFWGWIWDDIRALFVRLWGSVLIVYWVIEGWWQRKPVPSQKRHSKMEEQLPSHTPAAPPPLPESTQQEPPIVQIVIRDKTEEEETRDRQTKAEIAQMESLMVQDMLNRQQITEREARQEITRIRMRQLELRVVKGGRSG